MKQEPRIDGKETLLEILDKEIYDFCHDCPARSGSDCTRSPYTEGCLKGVEEIPKGTKYRIITSESEQLCVKE